MHDNRYFSDEASTIYLPHLLAMSPQAVADALPNVPTMAGTRLQLELLLQESLIDLSAVTEVILSDAGATLQILRLIGEEYPFEEDRPTRIEDCIASLNMAHCYDAVCASSIPHNSGIIEQWQHFRRVAQCARELAKCVEGVSPEEAYLVGLLYELGKLPRLLGWKATGDSSSERKALAVMLADYWHLPAYVLTAIREQQEAVSSSRWNGILQMAECAVDEVEAGIAE
jgi:HD-like signal output (HDOD) protein